ncbi:MAG: acetolactate decarboxylase [Thermodesulfobacteriota bacterium]
MKRICILCLLLVFLTIGCASHPHKDAITQTSTIDILMAGVYDGDMTLGELREYGDFGIGTFNRLDGEMIVLDDTVYQVKAAGRIYRPADDVKTPFAAVSWFDADQCIEIKKPVNYEQLQSLIDKHIHDPHIFYGIRVSGRFSKMHTRSVPAQQKPYTPLAEVAKTQPEFVMKDISGTIVGFRCPDYVKGINVPGYHLHFISHDLKQGGHILEFELSGGKVEIDSANRFTLIMPGHAEGRQELDLSLERDKELEEVEK